ncbi:protein mono-ADP-ribosyltransferase PARP12-like [Hemiscyllium ocellatum]|uniref:protein mono-ADP-ribosyltransferase PARP12-like n=1 Tax=Hemiscyllium ocellatum TaxID=170820 RepID=UPI00296660FC|nr:protein mono-ADP-ribosyltransferase PARP12-like [Hemiscyllium ocellatum]
MSLSTLQVKIVKILCSNDGSLLYEQLRRIVSKSDAVSDVHLTMALKSCQRFTIVQGTGGEISEAELTSDSRIIATSVVRLCKDYPNKKCQDCGQLHLCRFFILGHCKYSGESDACKYSHDIHSLHNWKIIRFNQLQDLDMKELRFLLLQNDPSLLPEVCLHYNRGNGESPFGGCSHKRTCNKLHICSYFITRNCKYGAECRRSHSVRDNSALLKKFSLDETVMRNLLLIYQNRSHIKEALSPAGLKAVPTASPTKSQQNSDAEELCLYYIRKNCRFKDKCIRVHFNLPYRWQICKGTWQDLPNMEEIEMEFCDPKNITSSGPTPINFESMMCGSHQVRRLCTASSVTKPPHCILTTEWLWYMNDMFGKWTEYDCQDDVHVTSADLENVYLANSNAEVSIGEFNETLSFKEMIQKDKFSESAHEVRRRPRFISKEDVETKVNSVQSGQGKASSCESKSIPDYWDKSALTSVGYTRIQLSPLSNEYKKIQSLFENSMEPGKIQKIDRIQNLGLWEIFQWQKEQIKKKNHEDVDEQFLFHEVTDHSIVDAICYQNFDWGSFSQNGTLYGKGTYFAVKASNANFDLYSDSTAYFKIMFLARVLIGKFIKGHPSYDRPPSQDAISFKPYDSCVDCVDNPSLFVIFEKYHIYPEYMIQFSNEV